MANTLNSHCFLDDVLIASVGSLTEHNKLVEETIKAIDDEGLSLKATKCQFSVKEIEWLGYKISKEGIEPIHSKIQDIANLLAPTSLTQLRSFVGSINHLCRFIKDSQMYIAVFKDSLKKDNKISFHWTEAQNEALEKLKELLANITKNYLYSPDRKTRL